MLIKVRFPNAVSVLISFVFCWVNSRYNRIKLNAELFAGDVTQPVSGETLVEVELSKDVKPTVHWA